VVRLKVIKKYDAKVLVDLFDETPIPYSAVLLNLHLQGMLHHSLAPFSGDATKGNRILEVGCGFHEVSIYVTYQWKSTVRHV
jgi:hypothetical protein